jgi:hypothetical protein
MGLHSKNKIMLCMFEIHRGPSVSWQDTTLFGWDIQREERWNMAEELSFSSYFFIKNFDLYFYRLKYNFKNI